MHSIRTFAIESPLWGASDRCLTINWVYQLFDTLWSGFILHLLQLSFQAVWPPFDLCHIQLMLFFVRANYSDIGWAQNLHHVQPSQKFGPLVSFLVYHTHALFHTVGQSFNSEAHLLLCPFPSLLWLICYYSCWC